MILILLVAAKAGLWKDKLEEEYPRIGEIPFDSTRKLMSTVHKDLKGQAWVFTKGSIEEILRRSSAMAQGQSHEPLTRHGQTMTFFTLTMFQMFHVLAIRSERDYLWTIGLFSNPKLMGAVLLTIVFQMAITYSPPLQPIFHTTALTAGELAACIVVSSTVIVAVEGEKWLRYRRKA